MRVRGKFKWRRWYEVWLRERVTESDRETQSDRERQRESEVCFLHSFCLFTFFIFVDKEREEMDGGMRV